MFAKLKDKSKAIGKFIAEKAYFFMLGIAVLLLACGELPFFDRHPHWQIFVKEVAFALIIAMLFSFTIEKYQRQEFVKLVNKEREDLKKDIFLYAYGHEIGDQIRLAMKADILKCPFQKENMRLDWEFSEKPKSPEHVIVKKRQTYILRNTTPSKQAYTFQFTQFSASEQDVLASKVFECLKVQTEEKGEQAFKEKQMSASGTAPHEHTLTKQFPLGPNEHMEVFFSHTETRRKCGDDTWESMHPVVGVTEILLRVNEPLNLTISAACKGKSLETTAQHDPPRLFVYRTKEGLLPYQGLLFSWSPEKKNDQIRSHDVAHDS